LKLKAVTALFPREDGLESLISTKKVVVGLIEKYMKKNKARKAPRALRNLQSFM
jgi:hypothetical protein